MSSNSKNEQISDSGESLINTATDVSVGPKTAFDWDLFDDRGKVLNDLRVKQEFVDVLLATEDGGEETVHLAAVSALGRDFTDYLIQEIQESEVRLLSNGTAVKKALIKETVKSSLKSIVDFAYTGCLQTTIDDVWPLIVTAEHYHLEDVLDSSLTFMITQLTIENCVRVFQLGLKYRHKLSNASYAFIKTNFTEIVDKCIDFASLGYSELVTIIIDDELNVRTEKTVFEAVIRWVTEHIETRTDKLCGLLSRLRFARLELSFIENQMASHPLVVEDKDSTNLIKQFLKDYKTLSRKKDGNGLYVGLKPIEVRPRIPHQMVVTFGGWKEGIPSTLMEIYDIRTNLWFDTRLSHERPRAYHGIQVVDGLMYVIGGTNGTDILNTVECFNPIVKKWYQRSPMQSQRCYVSTVTADGIIYALGGHSGRQRMKTCESYDPKTDQWTGIEEMNMARSDASAALHDRKIYIAGGLNDQMIENTVEVYDLTTKTWTFIQSMSIPRTSLGLVAHKSSLYAVGGNNGVERLQSVERYDFRLRSWLPMPPMMSKRSTFATAVIENKILVMGGYNGQTPISLVEWLDLEDNQWKQMRTMRHDRSGLGVCVLTGLSNTQDYTFIGVNTNKSKAQDIQNEQNTEQVMSEEDMDTS